MTEATKLSYPTLTNQWIAREIDKGDFEGIEQSWVRDLPAGERVGEYHKGVANRIALDLGAGIGLVTRVLRTKFDSVIAVEGNIDLSAHWSANQAALLPQGGFGSATLVNGIVGSDRMRVSDDEWWKSTTSDKPITAPTPTHDISGLRVSFAQLLEDHKPVTVVMDIEGAEYGELCEVAIGAPELLAGVDDLIVELHPGLWPDPSQRDNLVRMLTDCGYTLVRRDVAKGWPVDTPHPLAIEHDWLTRRDVPVDESVARFAAAVPVGTVPDVPDYRLGVDTIR